MRAAVIEQCGRPPVVGERPLPVPGEGQVRVAVTAVPISPLDVFCATGTSYFGVPAVPYVPGVQGVGRLDDGTPVWFPTTAGIGPGDGGMAEYAVVAADDVVALPDGVEHALVAALGLSAVAAWAALTWRGGLRPGEQVVVLGGGGVVGQVAVQAARLGGSRRVVAVCRSAAAQDRARRSGADAVVTLTDDDDAATVAARIRAAADGPVDLVVDPLFGAPASAALQTLGQYGRLVNLGESAGPRATFDSATIRSRSLRVLGYTNTELSPAQRAETLRTVVDHAAAGRLTVDHEVVPLGAVTGAWGTGAGVRTVLLPG